MTEGASGLDGVKQSAPAGMWKTVPGAFPVVPGLPGAPITRAAAVSFGGQLATAIARPISTEKPNDPTCPGNTSVRARMTSASVWGETARSATLAGSSPYAPFVLFRPKKT